MNSDSEFGKCALTGPIQSNSRNLRMENVLAHFGCFCLPKVFEFEFKRRHKVSQLGRVKQNRFGSLEFWSCRCIAAKREVNSLTDY